MEKVIEISNIIKNRSKYKTQMDNIKSIVKKAQELYIIEVKGDPELIIEIKEQVSYFNSIIEKIFDNMNLKEINVFNNVINKLINDYNDDDIFIGFLLITYVSLVKITNKKILVEPIEEQITMCNLIDSLGEDSYKDPKYVNLYLNEDIREKLKEIVDRKKYRLESLFICLVDDLDFENVNYKEINPGIVKICLNILNDYLNVKKPFLLENSYEVFLEQYSYLRTLSNDDRYDYLFRKLDQIMAGNDEELKNKINLIAAQEDSIINKIKELDLLVNPLEDRIIDVDFQNQHPRR